jgi:hypothetical protein
MKVPDAKRAYRYQERMKLVQEQRESDLRIKDRCAQFNTIGGKLC